MAGDRRERPALVGTRALERFLRRWYALAGGSVALDVGGTVQPSVEMRPQLPWEFRDWGIIPWGNMTAVGAIAAEHSYLEVQQVPGFDVVVLTLRTDQPATVRLMASTIGDATNIAATSRDTGFTAFGQNPVPALFLVGATCLPGALGGIALAALAANQEYAEPIIIRSGSPNVIVLNDITVNQAFSPAIAGFLVPTNMNLA